MVGGGRQCCTERTDRARTLRAGTLDARHGVRSNARIQRTFLNLEKRIKKNCQGALTHPLQIHSSPRAATANSPKVRAVRASARSPCGGKGFRRTDARPPPCVPERPSCDLRDPPRWAPARSPNARPGAPLGPREVRSTRPHHAPDGLARRRLSGAELGTSLINSTFYDPFMIHLDKNTRSTTRRGVNRPLPAFPFTQEDRNA